MNNEMLIKVERKWKKDTYTIGRVYIDGIFFSNSLEDVDRGLDDSMSEEEIKAKKVYGKTAIPTGRYEVIYTYSPKFRKHLPRLQNVKGFVGILIHALNKPEETEGCIGVGLNSIKGMITNSRWYSDAINKRIDKAIRSGKKVYIEIV